MKQCNDIILMKCLVDIRTMVTVLLLFGVLHSTGTKKPNEVVKTVILL